MLTDTERKIHRIIYNLIRAKRYPTLGVLEQKSGRRAEVVLKALTNLEKKGIIEWPFQDVTRIIVIHANDPDAPVPLPVPRNWMDPDDYIFHK